MPIKLGETEKGSIESRIDKFRKTIPNEQGYEVLELARIKEIAGSVPQISSIIRRKGWAISRFKIDNSHKVTLLVNPRTLAKYANQNKA